MLSLLSRYYFLMILIPVGVGACGYWIIIKIFLLNRKLISVVRRRSKRPLREHRRRLHEFLPVVLFILWWIAYYDALSQLLHRNIIFSDMGFIVYIAIYLGTSIVAIAAMIYLYIYVYCGLTFKYVNIRHANIMALLYILYGLCFIMLAQMSYM